MESVSYSLYAFENHTLQLTTSTDAPELSSFVRNLYFWLFGVALCVLSSVGVVTNVINIYALTLTVRTNRRPMYHCLICIAVADMLLMCILLVTSVRFHILNLSFPENIYTEKEGMKVDYPSYVLYNIWYIPANILITISNWSVVTMGAFRLVAVFFPLKAASLCTVTRVRLTLVAVCLFSLLVNLPQFLEIRLEGNIFKIKKSVEKYNTISVVFTSLLPILSVFVINVILIGKIRCHRALMESLLEGQRSDERSRLNGTNMRNIRQGEATLISISLFSVIMALPNVSFYTSSYLGLLTMEKNEMRIYQLTATMSIYVNHACNFFFFVLVNKPFRTLLWKKVRGFGSTTAAPSTYVSTMRSVGGKSGVYESIKLAPVAANEKETENGSLLHR